MIETLHGYDLAQHVLTLSLREKKQLLKTISVQQAAEFFPYIDEEDVKVNLFLMLPVKKRVSVLEEMATDDAAELLRAMPESLQLTMIQKLEHPEDMDILLKYSEDEIGAIMTRDYIFLDENLDVKEATKQVIIKASEVETIKDLCVVNEAYELVGSISLKTLLKTKSPKKLVEIMKPIDWVYAHDALMPSLSMFDQSKQSLLPVLDENQVLLGIVTLDDAIEQYEEEAIEDFQKLAALPHHVEDAMWYQRALKRFPWLLTLLVLFIPMMLLTKNFEVILEQFVILILFQPLILGSAGNVATQTLALTLQHMNKQQSSTKVHLVKELTTSLLIGLSIGVIAFLLTYGYGQLVETNANPFMLALVIGMSLWSMLFIAPMLAILIPLLLRELKIDPAYASGPFITTLIDVSALFIYFSLATLFLGGSL
jgi:magnesium transporter